MYFKELLYIFMFSLSNENKSSVDQVPHNSIVSPLAWLIFHTRGGKKNKTEKGKMPVLKPPICEKNKQKKPQTDRA